MFNNKIRKHVGIWLATFACAAAVSCYTSQDVQADHYSYGNNPTHQSTDAEIAQGLVRARPYKYVHSVPRKQMYVFHLKKVIRITKLINGMKTIIAFN